MWIFILKCCLPIGVILSYVFGRLRLSAPDLSALGVGLPRQYRVLFPGPGHSNQTHLQRYSNPANQGFCCVNAHAFHQLSCSVKPVFSFFLKKEKKKTHSLSFSLLKHCLSLLTPTNPLSHNCHCRTRPIRPPRRTAKLLGRPSTSGLPISVKERRRTAPKIARGSFVSRGGFVSSSSIGPPHRSSDLQACSTLLGVSPS